MIINKEDYEKIPGVEYDIEKRWEEGWEHHPRSEEICRAVADIDYVFQNDCLCLKFGGDGDSGESLMYAMDIYFDEIDAMQRIKDAEKAFDEMVELNQQQGLYDAD